MPLHKPSMSSTYVECMEGSVFVIYPSKRSQSPIIFGKTQPQGSMITDLSSDLEPPQYFHYIRSAQHMMRKMGYSLQRGNGLNFRKWRRDFLVISCQKENWQITMIKHAGGWDMLHLHPLHRFDPKSTNRSRHALPLPSNGSQMLVWEQCSRVSR